MHLNDELAYPLPVSQSPRLRANSPTGTVRPLGTPQDPKGYSATLGDTRRTAPGTVRPLGRPQDPKGYSATLGETRPPGSRVALLGVSPRPLRVHCDPWGDPKTLRVSHLRPLGRPAGPLRVRPTWLFSCSTWGDPKTATWFFSCSTWGDPKTARGIRALAHHLLYLGRPAGPLRVRHLLYLGRPQDRTRDTRTRIRAPGYAHPDTRTRLTRCSTWGDPKSALAPEYAHPNTRTDSPIAPTLRGILSSCSGTLGYGSIAKPECFQACKYERYPFGGLAETNSTVRVDIATNIATANQTLKDPVLCPLSGCDQAIRSVNNPLYLSLHTIPKLT